MTSDSMALEASDVGKRFARTWALRHCSLAVPRGKVAALVGPNGAGKSTLLRLASGLTTPTEGTLRILGDAPIRDSRSLLPRIGYLDQDRPTYEGFLVGELLRFGARANPAWDRRLAESNVRRLGISLRAKVGRLSTGQRAQVALTLALAKQPELLLLDEPAAALDPVAREDLLRLLMDRVAHAGTSVLLSTHLLSDVSSVCDFLVIIANSHVVLCDDLEFVAESHRIITSSTSSGSQIPAGAIVIERQVNDREITCLVRLELPLRDDRWRVITPSLEEIVLAYLRSANAQLSTATEDESSQGARVAS